MKNNNKYHQDNELESTLSGFDHHAYEVTFKDGEKETKENYIARNIPHLVFVLGRESNSLPVKHINEIAYCPNVFMFLNTERGLADLTKSKENKKGENMKYKNYEELKAAYDSGELDREENILHLDNDSCHVYKDDECVFRGEGYRDLQKLAQLAGLPAEWV